MTFTKVLGPGIHTLSNITSHNIHSSGIITAIYFVGDGSGLTGVASTDNIVTGSAATFTGGVNINSDLDVDGHTNLDNVSIAGVTTFAGGLTGTTANFSGDVTVGGVLTYEDVKNVDSVGLITARNGINVSGGNVTIANDIDVDGHTNLDNVSIAGFTTVGAGLLLNNSIKLRFGNTSNSYIYYDAGSGVSHFQLTGGNLSIASNVSNSYEYMIRAHTNGRVELYYDGDEKIRTTDKGILVGTGVTIETNGQANFVGVVTATSSPSANMGLRNVSISTVSPSGGSDGDLWFTYVA